VQAIADDTAATKLTGRDPLRAGELTQDEIDRGQADPSYRLRMQKEPDKATRTRGPRYTPVSKRQDKPDGIAWIIRNHPEVTDGQISRLIGTTRTTISAIRDRSHWNIANIQPKDPVTLGLCSQRELDGVVTKAAKAAGMEAAPQDTRLAGDREALIEELRASARPMPARPRPRMPRSSSLFRGKRRSADRGSLIRSGAKSAATVCGGPGRALFHKGLTYPWAPASRRWAALDRGGAGHRGARLPVPRIAQAHQHLGAGGRMMAAPPSSTQGSTSRPAARVWERDAVRALVGPARHSFFSSRTSILIILVLPAGHERLECPAVDDADEWLFGRMLAADIRRNRPREALAYWRAAGWDDERIEAEAAKGLGQVRYRGDPVPSAFVRMEQGDRIPIGARNWRVVIGSGHSPEHACLLDEEAAC
jgi:hypothetical protein